MLCKDVVYILYKKIFICYNKKNLILSLLNPFLFNLNLFLLIKGDFMKKISIFKFISIISVFSSMIFSVTSTVNAAVVTNANTVSTSSLTNLDENSNKDTLPTYYSSVDLGYTPPIKSQTYNDCWAYSSTTLFESKLLREGKSLNNIGFTALDMNKWATTTTEGKGWQRSIYDSAYVEAAIGYLTSWANVSKGDLSQYGTTAVRYLSKENSDEIKNAIIKNGAVYTGYSESTLYSNDTKTSYFCPPGSSEATGHGVAVVGWDDNYSKDNFKKVNGVLPENDGAWLIQNSWGNYNSLGGYFWISYEDAYIFSSKYKPAYTIEEIISVNDNIKLFQNEKYGATYEFDYVDNNEITYLNKFDFSSGYNNLKSVVFESTAVGSDYIIYYVPIDETAPTNEENLWIELAKGTVPYSGYINVDCNEYDLPVSAGAIGVKICKNDTSNSNSIGVGEWLVTSNSQKMIFLNETQKDESYIYYDKNMIDIMDWYKENNNDEMGGTLVIKAIAEKSEEFLDHLGDTNLDGIVDIMDATTIQRYLAGYFDFTELQKRNADVDGDGIITVSDTTRIQMILARYTQY